MLTLRFLYCLLDLDFGVGALVDLGVEERHQVFPRFDERIGHELAPPSCVDICRMHYCAHLAAQFIGSTRITTPMLGICPVFRCEADRSGSRKGVSHPPGAHCVKPRQATAIETTGGITTLVLASILAALAVAAFVRSSR